MMTDVQIETIRENHPKFDESLFLFSRNGKIRSWIYQIVHARYQADEAEDKGILFTGFFCFHFSFLVLM